MRNVIIQNSVVIVLGIIAVLALAAEVVFGWQAGTSVIMIIIGALIKTLEKKEREPEK